MSHKLNPQVIVSTKCVVLQSCGRKNLLKIPHVSVDIKMGSTDPGDISTAEVVSRAGDTTAAVSVGQTTKLAPREALVRLTKQANSTENLRFLFFFRFIIATPLDQYSDNVFAKQQCSSKSIESETAISPFKRFERRRNTNCLRTGRCIYNGSEQHGD